MNNYDPILIAGPPRSGITMMSGIFHYHGVWIGPARTTKYPKSNSSLGTENIDIKKYLKSLLDGYKNWNTPLPDIDKYYDPYFKDIILG